VSFVLLAGLAGAPGAIGSVEDDGHTIRGVSGVGNLRTGQPPRPVQTFRVASQTKAFVSTIVLQLVAEGRVALDAPVARYLPRLLPDGDRITVRQLLNHTSGLYDPQVEVYQTLQDIYDLRFEHWTPRQVVALSVAHGLLFPPGSAFSYSNINYVVTGRLVERVTGTSIVRQLQRRLIRPLGLRHSWFPTDTAALPRPRLHGHMPWTPSRPWSTPTSPGSTRRSSGPRGRWSPTSTTWTASTTPCSTGACCPGGCWPRC
jgi:D-alanyl-D-alanine carboxypeptidase